ncbi:YjfB family protein [Bacillus sp. UMB0728]|uniref:YjfB family protein n=1 Tax=Bacillus sp. UMB0728 TaxID=2066052 RepID=UPI000C755D5D|nr:YjfB family protein [Bacillus sp. UMB0728]PLR73718.1 putative motility protein [Bacillus sp. UMB0728]
MDIAMMSMALSQGKVQQEASLSVMKMAIGDVKQQGEALQQLMSPSNTAALQHAAQPHLGGNIDLKG